MRLGMGILKRHQLKRSNKIFAHQAKTVKKGSITRQIVLVMIGLVAGTVLLCWILNTVFLEGFYSNAKKNMLIDDFSLINDASKKNKLDSTDFLLQVDKISANNNLTITMMNAEGTVIKSTESDYETIRNQFLDIMFKATPIGKGNTTSGEQYQLFKQQDARFLTDYYVLEGTLSDGSFIMLRTPIESIKESVLISNQFLAYVAVIAVILSAIIAYFMTRRITMPILELTDISKKMIQLDFEIKYKQKGNNEIDQLGLHMNQLSASLEKTISELKSANNELILDNTRKTEIDEMRKEFLSNVSHELKTPLALIQGYAEGLQACINDDAESRSFYCDVIMDEADKMNRMVKKLLTLNQLEFGNDQIMMERFDITELIRGIVNSSSILLEQNQISLEFDSKEPTFVWADEFKVEEVITNYLSNAIHHAANEKNIRIFYTMKQDCIRVSVFNTGTPIPEEDIDNVWVKFYKVDKARTREYGGSGIGLSIVKAIMDSFNRECGVINHENGVEFWLELDMNFK